jgi:hypothetical protein
MRFTGFFLLLCLVWPLPLLSQPQSSEQPVNTTLAGHQESPAIAKDQAGNFIITWVSDSQDDGLPGVYARRYNQNGLPLAPEFQVNSFWAPHERPRAAMAPNGGFVITWVNHWIEGATGGGIAARVFDTAGNPLGPEFQINQYEPGFQGDPAVATDSLGYFVITWQSWREDDSFDIYARLFDDRGIPRSDEFRINSFTQDNQTRPCVAMDNSGNFVVAWTSFGQDGDETGIYARRLDRDGRFLSEESRVNFATQGRQEHPAICMDALGNFIVCWQSAFWNEDLYDVFARTFDYTGQLKGPEFRVNNLSEAWQLFPAIDCDAQGRFVVTWQGSDPADDSFVIYVRQFDQYGEPLQQETRINSFTDSRQISPQIVVLFPQTFCAAWQSQHSPETGWDIYHRIYQGSASLKARSKTRIQKRYDE